MSHPTFFFFKTQKSIFMLLEMGLVSKDEIDDLWDQFSRLDVSKSGYLDQEDLIIMARLQQEGLIE